MDGLVILFPGEIAPKKEDVVGVVNEFAKTDILPDDRITEVRRQANPEDEKSPELPGLLATFDVRRRAEQAQQAIGLRFPEATTEIVRRIAL